MKHRKTIICCIIIMSFSLTGCWDLVEINRRAMVAAMALDKKGNEIGITYSVPNLPALTGQGGEGEKNYIKKTTGKTLLQANKKFGSKSNLKLTFEHTQVIILGDEFLQDDQKFKSALDYFDRSPEYAKSVAVVATDKTGEELIQSKPNASEPIGVYINTLFDPSKGKMISSEKVSLNQLISSLYDTDGNAQLPVIISKDKEIQTNGIVLLKDYKKCYTLSEDQLIPFNWLKGKGEDTYAEVEYEDTTLSYEISQLTRKLSIKDTKNNLEIKILIQTEGDIDEFIMESDKNVFKDKTINEIEKLIQTEMENKMDEMVQLIQKEVGYDVFNISGRMKIQNGDIWERIKDQWDAYFTSAKISVEVQPHIRRIGMSK